MFTLGRTIHKGVIALALFVTGQAFAQKAEAPLMEVGDKWTYKFTNTGDRKEPTTFYNQVMHVDAQSAWIYGESQDPQAREPKFAWRYDHKRAGFLESFSVDRAKADKLGRRLANRQPNDDMLQFPLEVGKEWKVKELWSNGNGFTEYKAKVEAFEKIKVQAGEFDAYKVSFKGFWTRTADGSGSGRAEWVMWFAPAVKREVKRMFQDRNSGGHLWNQNETELLNWEPKAALGGNPVVGLRSEAAATAPAPNPAR